MSDGTFGLHALTAAAEHAEDANGAEEKERHDAEVDAVAVGFAASRTKVEAAVAVRVLDLTQVLLGLHQDTDCLLAGVAISVALELAVVAAVCHLARRMPSTAPFSAM
jgi:RecJ-like exonuclease